MTGPHDDSRRTVSVPDELKGRDPGFIRKMLPRFWLGARIYFRAEVSGFDNVPDEPVLFVGNHSGGSMSPDTVVFTLAYNTYFTVEGRPLAALAHDIVLKAPVMGDVARKLGMVVARPKTATNLLRAGAHVLVYPGGDVDALRPWRDRNKIMFDGRQGFLKVAHACRVKIVPVIAVGGQETFFVLNDGRRTAKTFRFDKLLRVKSVPISLSMPWGLLPGDLPHIPFPAKIRIQVLPAIDLRERFGDEPDWDEAYGYVASTMQVGLSGLAAKTVFPILG